MATFADAPRIIGASAKPRRWGVAGRSVPEARQSTCPRRWLSLYRSAVTGDGGVFRCLSASSVPGG